MKNRIRWAVSVLFSTLGIGFANSAAAQFYVGAHVGRATAESLCSSVPAGFAVNNCDDVDSTVPKGLIGYRFTQNWGIEGGYAGGKVGAPGTQTIEATVMDLVAVYTIPLEHGFEIYGKAGLYHAKVKQSDGFISLAPGAPPIRFSAATTVSNTAPTFGFGAQYNFTRNIGVRLEYQFYPSVGEADNLQAKDVNAVSIGAVWRF